MNIFNHKYTAFFLLMALAIFAASFIALISGSSAIGFSSLLETFGDSSNNTDTVILFELRLPRILLAALSGALLASGGAAMQGLFRNPLADPSLIGVTAGASLGGASVIFFSLQFSGNLGAIPIVLLTSIGACLGAAVCVAFVYKIASSSRGTSVATMLLAGIAITAFASSFTSLFEFFSDDITLRRLSLWRMGSLDAANYLKVGVAAIIVLLTIGILQKQSSALNAFLLGESEARHLGVETEKCKALIIACVALSAGISVALTGAIAFVGLIVPHALRLLLGPNHKTLIIASAMGGALLLVIADTIARLIVAPAELPTGLITAVAGAPFFVSLLRSRFNYGI